MSTSPSMFQFADAPSNVPDDANEETKQEVNLDSEVEVKDSSIDFNITPPPPPPGRYPAKLSLAEKGIEGKHSEKVGDFITVYLQVSLITDNEAYNGYIINDYPNSIYDKRKGTTALHSLMSKLSDPLPTKISLRAMKEHVERVLNSNPVGNVEIDWQAKELDKGNKRADKNGYVTLASKYSQFPKNPDGSRSNFVKSERDGNGVPATAQILGYY